MIEVFSNKPSSSSPGRSTTVAQPLLVVWEFYFKISYFMLLPPCGCTLSESSFCVFCRAQNVLKLAAAKTCCFQVKISKSKGTTTKMSL